MRRVHDTRTTKLRPQPVRKVVYTQPDPEGNRYYVVMQQMQDDRGDAGWLIVSEAYEYEADAYQELGAMVSDDNELQAFEW